MTIDFPIYFRMAEVDVAIVPAATLKALMHGLPETLYSLAADEGFDDLDAAILQSLLDNGGRRSPILYDRALARFIIVGLKTKSETTVLADCRERFGYERSPSSTGMNRFSNRVQALRRELRPKPDLKAV